MYTKYARFMQLVPKAATTVSDFRHFTKTFS